MCADEKKVKLSKEKLQIFLEKSDLMIPRCFGGYDENDPVCQKWCARATERGAYLKASDIRSKLHEIGNNSFFFNDQRESCESRRKEIEEKMKHDEKRLSDKNRQRSYRDCYFLDENSSFLKRIPVGDIRTDKDFINFVGLNNLYLETPDYRIFAEPYGPWYPKATGKIYQITAGGAGPDDSVSDLAHIKVMRPSLPERWRYPVKVIKQTVTKDGDLKLYAEICHNINYSKEVIDYHNTNGKKITIELFGDSAKTFILIDDLGKL